MGQAEAAVPAQYYPNYQIQDKRDNILDTFVELEAQKKIGQDPSISLFSQLRSDFASVFPFLPSDSNYKIIYEQCTILSSELSWGYTYDKFINFMENCFDPLNRTIKEITQKATMKPSITANPTQWSAPLTVTFDAKKSKDPSNDTIPSNNYFWYFKDVDGVDKAIGQWPVVNYTFNKEGTYIVRLTLRSANQQSKGILDGQETIAINVAPQAATLVVYANGQRLGETSFTKIGTQEAQRGVLFDGSATQPKGGRTILSHQWEIKQGNNLLSQSDIRNGNPGNYTVQLPNNGEYTITLITNDNENNVVEKSFLLSVSDPIAVIKHTPEEPDTQTSVKFDASASYSIQSSIRLYTWEIFDEQGNKLFTTQKKNFSQDFLAPGTYNIKLTVQDEIGQENSETLLLFVDSTTPQPQFTIEPTAERTSPSQFILDASLSSDIDVANNVDELNYERSFSDPDNTIITPMIEGNNEKVVIAFNKVGDHKVKLIVTDSFGKRAEVEKTIKVQSALRPRVIVSPIATTWGNPVTFAVTANKDIVSYNWDFGNNVTRLIQSNNIQYTYDKAWVYQVSLTAIDENGDENEITTSVFIGELNKPTIAYKVTDNAQNIMKQNSSCVGDDGVEHIAYEIERQKEFVINSNESVNIKGRSSGLKTFFSPQNKEIFETDRFTTRFRELWCKYITITLEDEESTITVQDKIWFKVINALPDIEQIILFFPQFGNEIGVGLDQNNVENIFESDKDELIVKVIAHNADDFDGQISTFTWYYYNKDDPNRLLEVKANPGNVPYAFFTMSKSALRWDYAFGVRMTDNDGGEITSEERIGQWPSLFFLPSGKQNIDIPIVTLKTNTINTKVGEEVTLDVVSKILSNRSDFEAARTIEYDFGDGSEKLRTKKSSITYRYEKAGKYTPKVKVTYRGNPGTAYGETINVQNALRASILSTAYDKFVFLRDLSMGEVEQSTVCFDRTKCKASGITQKNQKEYVKKYSDYGQYVLEFNVTDKFGNSAIDRRVINLTPAPANETIHISTVPEATIIDGFPTVRLWNSFNDEILLFVHYFEDGLCYIDTNIARDQDGDGISDNDKSMSCNSPKVVTYTPELGESQGRVFYEKNVEWIKKLMTQDFVIDFIDYDSLLSNEQKEIYFVANSLISTIDDNYLGNAIIKDELINIRDNLQNDSEVSLSLIAINDYRNDANIADKQIVLSAQEEKQLTFIESSLANTDVLASQWASLYFQAKQTILEYTPLNAQSDVSEDFFAIEQIEEPAKEWEAVKERLQNILNTLVENSATASDVTTDTISQEEIDLIVIPALCDILGFYNIPSTLCPNQDGVDVSNTTSTASSGLLTLFKWLGIIVLILGWLFLAIVVFFAIRSRLKRGNNAA